MEFLADEGVDRQIVERLRQDGHSVAYIIEMERGIEDDIILSLSTQTDAVLVTIDKDFGELVYRLQRAMAGVLLIRLAGLLPDTKAAIVAAAVQAHAAELSGAFAVVSPGRVRVRRRVE